MAEEKKKQEKESGLLDITAAEAGHKGGGRKYEYLHTPEREKDVQENLLDIRTKTTDENIRLVRCLICLHEHNIEYAKKTIITHLYSVHGMKKEDYQLYCLQKGWIEDPSEAPVRTPDLTQVFRAAGRKGATTLFGKIDRGETHLYRGDEAGRKGGVSEEYIVEHSDIKEGE